MSSAKKQTAALRATLTTLAALPIERLKAQFETAFSKAPGRLSRDRMVRALAKRGTTPAQDTPTAATKPPAPAKAKATPHATERTTQARDPRLQKIGATLTRKFKGKIYEAVVEHDGFRHAGRHWRSLTAVAKQVTGYPAISGPLFWGLTKPAADTKTEKPATPEPAKVPAKKRGRPISAKRKE